MSLSERLKRILTINCSNINNRDDLDDLDISEVFSFFYSKIESYLNNKENSNESDDKKAKYITSYTNNYIKNILRNPNLNNYIKFLPIIFVFELFKKHNALKEPILKELQKSTSMFSNKLFSNKLLIELYKAIMKIENCPDTTVINTILDDYEKEIKNNEINKNLAKIQSARANNEEYKPLLPILDNTVLPLDAKLTQLLTQEYKPKFINWIMYSTKNIHDVKKLFGDIYERINIQSPNDTIDDIEESISNKIDEIVNGTDDDKKNTLLALIREMVNSKITGGANIGGGNRKKKRTKKYKKNRSRKMQTRTRRKMRRKPSSIRRKN
jgi:hypothetical protein